MVIKFSCGLHFHETVELFHNLYVFEFSLKNYWYQAYFSRITLMGRGPMSVREPMLTDVKRNKTKPFVSRGRGYPREDALLPMIVCASKEYSGSWRREYGGKIFRDSIRVRPPVGDDYRSRGTVCEG
jgi:hypothetical protein